MKLAAFLAVLSIWAPFVSLAVWLVYCAYWLYKSNREIAEIRQTYEKTVDQDARAKQRTQVVNIADYLKTKTKK